MRQIDFGARPPAEPDQQQEKPGAREPDLFSENIVSLSDTLSAFESAAISTKSAGNAVAQTVRYR